MPTKFAVAVLAILLITAACAASQPTAQPATPTPGQSSAPPTQIATPGATEPGPTAEPGQTARPTGEPDTSPGPGTTPGPEVIEPLQAPELESIDEIAQALFDPQLAEQATVSMLDYLGIGIYEPDGTPIRAGTEASDADFFLFEPEVRGLVDLLEESTEFDQWIDFRDFHAALADLGFQGSAEELAAAYADSYAEDFEAPMSQFVSSLAFIDVDGQIPRFTAWLLILDGFVPPHASAEPIAAAAPLAMVGGTVAATSRPGRGGWGVSQRRLSQIQQQTPLAADPLVIAHLMLVVKRAAIGLTVNPFLVHEGHGSAGSPATISAEVRASALIFQSPFSGLALVPIRPTVSSGLAVTFEPDGTMLAHGSASPLAATTDALGVAKMTFTPNSEDANGQGYLVEQTSIVSASVPGSQIITQLYGQPALGALIPDVVRSSTSFQVQWHEPEAMVIDLRNHYDVTITAIVGGIHGVGDDSFAGTLVQQEDGTWQGVVTGAAKGNLRGQAFGRPCSSRWNASQKLLAIGESISGNASGDFVIRFHPLTAPSGSTGSGRCPPTRWKVDGVYMAPYNDSSINTEGGGPGLVFFLPNRPGGYRRYNVPSPGGAFVLKDTYWDVDIRFLSPP